MGFTTPCFIRKNTPEIRKRLKDLGYKECIGEEGPFLFTSYNIFDCMHSECGLNDLAYNGLIDCGENEELFLVIAALRDDTDRGQFFVTEARLGSINYPDSIIEKGSFIICCTDKWDSVDIPSHKASVLELIEHFKKQ